jgi:hypothetical protein
MAPRQTTQDGPSTQETPEETRQEALAETHQTHPLHVTLVEDSPEQPAADSEPSPAETRRMMHQLMRVQSSMQEQSSMLMQNSLRAQSSTPPPAPLFVPGAKQFRELGPRFFDGSETPLAAEEWSRSTLDNLHMSRCPEADWIGLVKKQLQGNARDWWDAQADLLEEPITWETFKSRFDEEYFPEAARTELEERFLTLKKGSLSVDQYHQEFTRLSRYATSIVRKPADKARRFLRGLDLSMQTLMTTTDRESYQKLLVAAKRQELLATEMRQLHMGGGKRPMEQTRFVVRPFLGPNQTASFKRTNPPGPQQSRASMVCHFCGKPGHAKAQCRKMLRQCLGCGSPAHQVQQCPNRTFGGPAGQQSAPAVGQQQQSPQQQQRAPATAGAFRGPPLTSQRQAFKQAVPARRHAFTLTSVEAETEDDVITGITRPSLYFR